MVTTGGDEKHPAGRAKGGRGRGDQDKKSTSRGRGQGRPNDTRTRIHARASHAAKSDTRRRTAPEAAAVKAFLVSKEQGGKSALPPCPTDMAIQRLLVEPPLRKQRAKSDRCRSKRQDQEVCRRSLRRVGDNEQMSLL